NAAQTRSVSRNSCDSFCPRAVRSTPVAIVTPITPPTTHSIQASGPPAVPAANTPATRTGTTPSTSITRSAPTVSRAAIDSDQPLQERRRRRANRRMTRVVPSTISSAIRSVSASPNPRSRWCACTASRSPASSRRTVARAPRGRSSSRATLRSAGANLCIAILRLEERSHLRRQHVPLPRDLRQVPTARTRQRVLLARTPLRGIRPVPVDQALLLESMQDRVERPVLEPEEPAAPLLHLECDLVPVHRSTRERREHQQLVDPARRQLAVECLAHGIGSLVRAGRHRAVT